MKFEKILCLCCFPQWGIFFIVVTQSVVSPPSVVVETWQRYGYHLSDLVWSGVWKVGSSLFRRWNGTKQFLGFQVQNGDSLIQRIAFDSYPIAEMKGIIPRGVAHDLKWVLSYLILEIKVKLAILSVSKWAIADSRPEIQSTRRIGQKTWEGSIVFVAYEVCDIRTKSNMHKQICELRQN